MKKRFKLAEWKKMEIHTEPTATHAMVRIDTDGRKWQWVASGKRVEAREVQG